MPGMCGHPHGTCECDPIPPLKKAKSKKRDKPQGYRKCHSIKTKKDLVEVLFKAYELDSISLMGICPYCLRRQGEASHGVCRYCKQGCGCSFDPTSSNDFCRFHGGTD